MFNGFLVRTFIFCTINLSALASLRNEAREVIQTIPPADQKVLEEFFRKLLFFNGFAYTLFGDKPVSTECFDLKENNAELFRISSLGYRTWKKYVHLFPKNRYLFLFYENTDEDVCEITLINKKSFHEIVAINKEGFTKVFGCELTSEKLLDLLIQKGSLWNTPMRERDDLIGVLLGYGKINADLFQKRTEIMVGNRKIKKKRTTPSSGYTSVEEELKDLNAALQSFSKEGKVSLNYMRLPGFKADWKNAETVQLSKNYRKQRKYITQRYSRDNVLEITFEQLLGQAKE